jgi:hypothetical protein
VLKAAVIEDASYTSPHIEFPLERSAKVADEPIALLSQSVGVVPTSARAEFVKTSGEFSFSQGFQPMGETQFEHGGVIEISLEFWLPVWV